ncbi:MAG: cysteine desulfurase [Gammaproteobacteria bacterium]|nr:cysteine desulfurase [Gammaproteobacteria bacterium]
MVYLDHNASTPLDARVLEAMQPYLLANFANASALYREGRVARAAIDQAREQVAAFVGAHPSQVVFTSGGTEANNLALKGAVLGMDLTHVAVSGIEHSSVLQAAKALQRRGVTVTQLPVEHTGQVDVTTASGHLTSGQWVTLMWVNNETGVIQEVSAMAAAAREVGAFVHCDAVQAAGKLRIDFNTSGAHVLTLSAHKINGPKGVGAMVFDRALDIEPLLHGGGHEHGLRAGTENVAGIVGFGAAAALAAAELEARVAHVSALRTLLEARLAATLPGITVFGQQAPRICNTSFIAVPDVHGETLLTALDAEGFAVGSGSACESKTGQPSHVLMAMGVAPSLAEGALRISLGHATTLTEIESFTVILAKVIAQFRDMAAVRLA